MVASWANDICRLCLDTTATHNFWPEHAECLTTYSSIHIKKNSILPDKLCGKCVTQLSSFYLFFKRSINAQLALDDVQKRCHSFTNDDNIKKNLSDIFEKFNENDALKSFQSKQLKSCNVLSVENKEQITKLPLMKDIDNTKKSKMNTKATQKKLDQNKKHISKTDNLSNKFTVLSKTKKTIQSPITEKSNEHKNKYASLICAPIRTKQSHVEFFLSNCCSICNIKFLTYGDLMVHNLNVHFSSTSRLPIAICDICKKEYKNKYILARHKKKSHLVQITTEVMCDKCSHICTSSSELEKHKKSCGQVPLSDFQMNPACSICNKIFDNKETLNIHMESHVTNVCEYCNHGFSSAIFLLNHVSEKHCTKKSLYTCYQCNQTFILKDMLLKHNQLIHNFFHEIFFCGHCNLDQLIFNNVFELWSHIESVHNTLSDLTETPARSGVKFCKIAPNINSSIDIVQSYLSCEDINVSKHAVKITEIINFPTVQCTEEITSENVLSSSNTLENIIGDSDNNTLANSTKILDNFLSSNFENVDEIIYRSKENEDSKHKKLEDQIDNNELKLKKKLKTFQCNFCCKKFLRLSNLQKHMIVHKSQVPICLACNFQASSQVDLKMHIKECKTFWKMNNLPCPICKKTLTTSAGLRYHLKVHSHDLKYKCSKCPRRFITLGKLNLHTRAMHSEMKPFMCNSCPRTFAISDHLRKHVLFAHSNQRNHVCNICSKAFLQKSHLNHHMWIHTGIKPHKCPYCQNKYSARCSLTKHLRRNHWEQQYGKKNSNLIEKIKHNLVNSDEVTESDLIGDISLVIVGDEDSLS